MRQGFYTLHVETGWSLRTIIHHAQVQKAMKLKDEVGMEGPKSTRPRFVGIIMSTI